MSDLIGAVAKTRKEAAKIFIESLSDIEGKSEIELSNKILSETKNHKELFETGWYDPPPGGVCALFDKAPFDRLKFESLRNSASWPINTSVFNKESVAILYFSPVDKESGMMGDIGFTVYKGEDPEIKSHLRKCLETTLSIAKHAEVGMKFSELHQFADNLFKSEFKMIGWMTTTNDPTLGANLGHTVPGSYDNMKLGNNFEEVKNSLRIGRKYINGVENFEIPATCAFTVETRLADSKNSALPNAFFHFIVCFDKGKKTILDNFKEIFASTGMDYMNIE